MPYTAKVFRILIASPSDVEEEREIIARVIQEWNDLHSYDKKVVLLPLRWETHASPEMGKRPQEFINRDVVDYCDMAIGVFWTRIGSPTEDFDSGTIEEIEKVGANGKIVMLYFSKAKVELDNVDLEQYKKLKEFKKKTYDNGLVENYKNILDFRDKLYKHLEIKTRQLINESISSKDFSLLPNLELGFLSNDFKFKDKINLKLKNFIVESIDDVPDYKEIKKIDNSITKTKDGTAFIISHNSIDTVNKDFYREYIEYFVLNEKTEQINFYLTNTSQISIRDIYVEIEIPFSPDYILSETALKVPYKTKNRFYGGGDINLSNFNSTMFKIEEGKDKYYISFEVSALQPQRSIDLYKGFYLSVFNQTNIILTAKVYADCFPKPLNIEKSIVVDKENVQIDALEFIKSLN
ncbi:hypothetical protein [Rufibacter hautae]|uniref:DUF4062 domain-containing protein n=1 Tax=Rufibacter hautae TaxID=2595005 RepID=A0A5B6TGG5_9BACT|nr:hypothetical protein [Rufibacter hautae]KAA3438290.1 hypothetical protein FOA19_13625 [Rufibacter hautae]